MRFVPDDRSFPAELSLNAGVAIELQRYLIHGLFPLSSVPPISLPIRPAFRTNLWLTVSTGYFSLDLHHSGPPLDLNTIRAPNRTCSLPALVICLRLQPTSRSDTTRYDELCRRHVRRLGDSYLVTGTFCPLHPSFCCFASP